MRFIAPIAILVATLTGCTSHNSFRYMSGAVWGTAYHITYNSDRDLSDSVFAVMNQIDASLSMFNQQSVVSRINGPQSAVADDDIIAVWEISKSVNAASEGAFDPTVAPLVDLWGFGRRGRDVALPDSAEVSRTLALVGMDKWSVESGSIVQKPAPRAALDFSAVAKGYGVDCIARMFERNGCHDFMVEIGGEIALSGNNPRGTLWRVQIDAPVDTTPGANPYTYLDTTDCGIATSGNYRNYRADSTGNVYGHTINPLTGFPRQKAFLSVTVVAPTCALADAVATAMMASDPAKADSIAARLCVKAFTIR